MPRWITSVPWAWIRRRMMLIAASWPSKSDAAQTKRSGRVSDGLTRSSSEAGMLIKLKDLR